jgi:hypothetical protein
MSWKADKSDQIIKEKDDGGMTVLLYFLVSCLPYDLVSWHNSLCSKWIYFVIIEFEPGDSG